MQGEYMTGGDPMTALVMQLLPLMIFQMIYAVVVFQLCRKQNWNAWLWTIAMLIPVVGMIVFPVIFLTTVLKTLDRLNVLENRTTG
jgi:hypothetical protein